MESSSISLFRKDKKKHRKRKRGKDLSTTPDDDDDDNDELRRDKKKDKKDSKKKKKKRDKNSQKEESSSPTTTVSTLATPLNFPHKYILAPMVGASELAFRLLCRQYGTQLAYTPMMSAHSFAHDAKYRETEFQTCAADRPLVCHFSANTAADLVAAARQAAPYCDAIDLNLGCPQRTAYLGHFGSYLLDDQDRELVCSMVRAAAQAVEIPIFCKIRLLDTLEATIQLCQQLQDAGASLVAVHARFRASWERKGPGARDGPALLEQVAEIKKNVRIPIITNGNTITYDDVVQNLALTAADGLMSAEGILDNPALFLPQWGDEDDLSARVPVIIPQTSSSASAFHANNKQDEDASTKKKERKLNKKLREICRLEAKLEKEGKLTEEETKKLSKKASIQKDLAALLPVQNGVASSPEPQPAEIALSEVHKAANNKLVLAHQYLDLATKYPVKIRSVVFHTRRMLKDLLGQHQLLEACLAATNIAEIRQILHKIEGYRANPASFVFDKEKEKAQKEALERKKREEGKRKAFEARMIRKAKREGREDLQYYLHQGAAVPPKDLVQELRQMPREKALVVWKENHAQHCLAFHLDPKGCTRGRACAFLHVDVLTSNCFNEQDEVAG